jgi:HKD family nuclease
VTLITGSHNLTMSAFNSNIEHSVETTEPRLIASASAAIDAAVLHSSLHGQDHGTAATIHATG